MEFNFSSKKFDYWPIYEAVKEYHLLGIEPSEWEMHNNYPGFHRKGEISAQHIQEESAISLRWKGLVKEVEQLTEKEITGTIFGFDHSLSGYLTLDTSIAGGVKLTKELHFYLSLLGPFYTVLGQDRYYERKPEVNLELTTCLTVSPLAEYEALFRLTEGSIEKKFKEYRFVPFCIGEMSLKGLDVDDSGGKYNRVFHALFNTRLSNFENRVGDSAYKNDQWIRKDYVDDGHQWVAYPIKKEAEE